MSEVIKKGNALLQLVDSPDEPIIREKIADLSREFPDAKRQLEEREVFLETLVEKTTKFDKISGELEAWVTATAGEPVFAEGAKATNPITVSRRLEQLEVSLGIDANDIVTNFECFDLAMHVFD